MPVFSCGGMRFQYKWEDVPPEEIPPENQANLEETVHRAVNLGINHLETARGYGSSEMQLGRFLGDFERERLIIQTKVAPTADPDEFERTFEKSMSYLKLDHVDLFSLHGINNAEVLEWAVRPGGCLERALKLKASGRVKHLGFSTHGSREEIIRAIETDEFDYVNLHWYFVNDLNWAAVRAAAGRDMGVFIISPTDKGGKLHEPPEKLRALCQPLSPIVFNDLYCLARPEVHTLSIGAARPSDFDEHLLALDYYEDIETTIAPIARRLHQEMARMVGEDWLRGWWKNIPEYYQMPGEVNVLEILRLWTCARSLDLVEFGKMRYNLMGNAGHWFPGKNAGNLDRERLRAKVAGNEFADRIPEILDEAHQLLAGEERQRLSKSD